MQTYRCSGENRNGRQCTSRLVGQIGETFAFCFEHQSQKELRLDDLQNNNWNWRPLFYSVSLREVDFLDREGVFRTHDFNSEQAIIEQPRLETRHVAESSNVNGQEVKKRHTRTLHDLSADDENIHTIEVQRPLLTAICNLRSWAEEKKVQVEKDLPLCIEVFLKNSRRNKELKKEQATLDYTQSIVNDFWTGSLKTISNIKKRSASAVDTVAFSEEEKNCLLHLQTVYSVNDNESVLGITFPVLSSWVWNRIVLTEDKEKQCELVKRFVEEMSESKGLCLQGNLTRLINVFSGLDEEVSMQTVEDDTGYISMSYMQQQVSASVSQYSKKQITKEDLFARVNSLMKRARASKEVVDDWMGAISETLRD